MNAKKEILGPSHLNAARFPAAVELRLREACKTLGVNKTKIIVAGTQAEIERRMAQLPKRDKATA